jgi:hydroxymethylpyrimidine kinase/phosphomethylpyrimidine kinase/thiamine-phosphate diphosphorylase
MDPDVPQSLRPFVPPSSLPSVPSSVPPSPSAPVCWSIAGTDPSAGAGIQADLKTFHGLGVYGCTVITAVIAQNTQGVQRVDCVAPALVAAQLESLADDTAPAAIKIGMLGTAGIVRVVAEALSRLDSRVICDPVLASSSGTRLLDDNALAAFRERLLPRVHLLTPNLPEAEILLGRTIQSPAEVEQAARDLLKTGVKCVLLKGGHGGDDLSRDYWTNGRMGGWISGRRIDTPHTHGGGCTLSSAIAAAHALGFGGLDAIIIARAYVSQGLRHAGGVGKGRGPLAHLGWPDQPQDLPVLTDHAPESLDSPAFPAPGPFGLYPIVDRTDWIARLLPLGVKTIQLRAKDLQGAALEAEVRRAIELGRQYDAQVYINDHWQLALALGAYGVHIGQDDLPGTDLEALRAAGLRLGVSTHGYAEIARALAVRPSYLAIGTLFQSPSKTFAHAPLGLPMFRRLRALVGIPVVAIGGITVKRAPAVYEAGADGIAVISDITGAPDLAARVSQWQAVAPRSSGR